jgi:hypothetical protein
MPLTANEQMLLTIASNLPAQLKDHVVFLGGPDLEDIITVLDGRSEVVSEIKSSNRKLQAYIANHFTSWLQNKNFINALPGLLPPDLASQERLIWLTGRMKAVAEA